jgi:hypothetical protein
MLLFSDVFHDLIHPQITTTQEDWDNLSAVDDDRQMTVTLADCEKRCAGNAECLQYSYESGRCLTSKVARRGFKKIGVTSGWMSERINTTAKKLGSCSQVDWILPQQAFEDAPDQIPNISS